jgi:hypothetical protein
VENPSESRSLHRATVMACLAWAHRESSACAQLRWTPEKLVFEHNIMTVVGGCAGCVSAPRCVPTRVTDRTYFARSPAARRNVMAYRLMAVALRTHELLKLRWTSCASVHDVQRCMCTPPPAPHHIISRQGLRGPSASRKAASAYAQERAPACAHASSITPCSGALAQVARDDGCV